MIIADNTMNVNVLLIIIFIIQLSIIYGREIDFTETNPACNLMIPIYNQNIISPLKQTVFKIRIFDSNDRETFEYDAENKKILQGFCFCFSTFYFSLVKNFFFFHFLFYSL